jgi:hypothetical protein
MRAATALTLFCTACGAHEQTQTVAQVTQRDSAGVTIVEWTGDPWTSATWATVDTANALRITEIDSVPATLFKLPAWADVLSDGSVVILDWRTSEVNIFSRSGVFLRGIGRKGQGPGEFEGPVLVEAGPGDSIHLFDPGKRIDVFSPTGEYVRGVQLGYHEPLAAQGDGSYIVVRRDEVEFTEAKVYIVAPTATIYRLATDGDTTQELARYATTQSTYRPRGRSHEQALQLFRPARYAVGASYGFVWCDAEAFSCDQWSAEGKKLRSVRVNTARVQVTDTDANSWLDARIEAYKAAQAQAELERTFAEADRGETFPLFDAYRVDDADRIWFRQYSPNADEVLGKWVVISAEGAVLGTVTIPPVYKVLKIARDFIVATERGPNDELVPVLYSYTPIH